MSAMNTTTCSPSSFQLRLALNPNKFPLNLRVHRLGHRVRVFSVLGDNEQSLKGDTWAVSSSSADSLSGWSGNDGENESPEPEKKSWPGGIVGAGVAGVILVAGLTFATLSISKRSTSNPIQEMTPLPSQQETISTADDQNDDVAQDENEGKGTLDDESGLLTTGIENDSSPPAEINEETNGTRQIDSSEADLKNELAIDNMLVSSYISDGTKSEKVAGSDDFKSQTELEENVTDSKPDSNPYQEEVVEPLLTENSNLSLDIPTESIDILILEPVIMLEDVQNEEYILDDKKFVSKEENRVNGDKLLGETSVSSVNEQEKDTRNDISEINENNELSNCGSSYSSAGIPAPSVVYAALQVVPGKVLVPAAVDQVQGQALSALQVLKVIESEVQPGDLCTRREYARWLLSASSTLSRNSASKVYPAMYIENVTELAFDDITPEDPDFPSIQGLAEAGLISSKLSRMDLSSHDEDPSSFSFFPESPLSRQDLVTWKMALEKRLLPEADKKVLHQISGFLDIDKINPDAYPALAADLSAGENGITALAFGFTKLFQPEKPVTKAQAAIALATGEAADLVSEELARIEAESIAEKAVTAHTALVAQVEKDVNASFEKELLLEREKVNAVEKLAEEARKEVERLREERERDGIALMKERAAVESEMEVLSKLRREVEEKMESLLSNKVEVSYEKERLGKLLKEAEFENQEIARLQHELEIERKALSMARAWAEDEAKRAREQAKVLEVARDRWEKHGIKVVVDNDLREDEDNGVTWLDASKQFSVRKSVNKAENLLEKLKAMAADVKGKAKITISNIMKIIYLWIAILKEWASKVTKQGLDFKDASVSKMSSSLQELQKSTAGYTLSIKEGVERLNQKFKT